MPADPAIAAPVLAVEPILSLQHVTKLFPVLEGILIRRPVSWIQAVSDVSFDLESAAVCAVLCALSAAGYALGTYRQRRRKPPHPAP